MRAMVINGFGGPEVLQMEEVPTPVPGEGEVLVKIASAGVNPAEWKTRQGKLAEFIEYHFPFIIGFDLAGVVEAVGPGVDRWAVGDRVFGMSEQRVGRDGTYAEYTISVPEMLAPMPEGWSYNQAAGIPVPGTTAYGAMVDAGGLQPGQTVLINGGAGGVGGIAIQIARAIGARVAVTCVAENVDYVTGLGADRAIDFQNEDVPTAVREWEPDGVDVVLDAVGLDTLLPRAVEVVKPGGTYVEIETLLSRASEDQITRAAANDVRVVSNLVAVVRQPEHLAKLAALCDEGKVRPPALEVMPLSEVADAHRRVEKGLLRGKLVLDVTDGI